MGIWRQLFLVSFFVLAPASGVLAAESNEQHAFDAARNELKAGFSEIAEKHFKEFVQVYTNSSRIPEVILLQAEALFLQKKYGAVLELLNSRQNIATNLADQYMFLRGEAQFHNEEYLASANTFAKLTKDFPLSKKRLEATVREAAARAALGAWPEVVALLQQTNGIFQTVALTNAGDKQVVQGYLLLSEAALAQANADAAEAALQPIVKLALPPSAAWQVNYLLGRIRLLQGRKEEALLYSTNMLQRAVEAGQPSLRADTVAFRADVLEKLGRSREAIDAYTNNLAAGVTPERQRQALLKTTELSLILNDVAGAVQMLKKFRDQFPAAPMADLVWLTLGELQLRQYIAALGSNTLSSATNKAVAANLVQEAQTSFEALAKSFPQSPLFGQGQLNLGWCLWLQHKLPECEKAFQAAVGHLPVSSQQATAYFKLADAQFEQNNFTNSMSNYMAVVEKFDALPEVKTNLFEPALYQSARAALAAKQPGAATNAIAKLLQWFPKGYHTDRALLYVGLQMNEQGKPEEARKIFSDLIAAVPGSELLPQVRLAVARTFEEQEKWVEAIGQYDSWLATYTNHEAHAAALYYQARANFFAQRETNAVVLFNQFIAKYPTNELSPRAQWWVASYYYKINEWQNAETHFQNLFQKWPASDLTYEARMMAGRSAVGRSGWTDAIRFFTMLTGDRTNCPPALWGKAMIAYGDVLISQVSTNKAADYDRAIQVFKTLTQSSHTNAEVDLAWGRLASCYYQWAQIPGQKDSLTNASEAFKKVIDSPRANQTARCIAKVGLGLVFEAQAEGKTGEQQTALFKQALTSYVEVFYDESGKPDVFWIKESGLNAGRMAEKLGMWPQAINVYERLKEMLPPLSAFFETRIRKAQEHLATAKVDF
jgi:TolA-binding protein